MQWYFMYAGRHPPCPLWCMPSSCHAPEQSEILGFVQLLCGVHLIVNKYSNKLDLARSFFIIVLNYIFWLLTIVSTLVQLHWFITLFTLNIVTRQMRELGVKWMKYCWPFLMRMYIEADVSTLPTSSSGLENIEARGEYTIQSRVNSIL